MPKVRKRLTEREDAFRTELIRFCGTGMLTQSAVMKFFGWSKPTARAWLADIPSMQGKYFTASDIARKMAQKGESCST